MRGYLLDTHILLWFLTNDGRLNQKIYEDIESFCNPYFVSVDSLREIISLQYKKTVATLKIKELVDALERYNINVLFTNIKHLEVLETLSNPIIEGGEHRDPIDRTLIAQAISEKLT